MTDLETGRVYWTATQSAEYVGISRATWASYASRGQCPAPVERFEGLRLWAADEVRAWHTQRPSQRRGRD
ncbi:helix-turn-helix transcriptional regulator [Corynebacterium sp. 21KM1197]|uniref:helix-turn-helix transcriptional regulator n=1 Tax=Corynebacterium sp. 21KM1197 TaxID=2989734 RepID=UPI0039AF55A8